MYGLLLEGMCEMITERFGEEAWEVIRDRSRINEYTFVTHRMYSEKVIPKIGQAAAEVTGMSYDEIMTLTGENFVNFLSKYGYDKMLRVLGRNMRDFLNGLDNLHEYLRFSYPKMKPPSFFCTDESKSGLTIHYRSKRNGYKNYVRGQLIEVGKLFYNKDVTVEVKDEGKKGDNFYVVYRLHFENEEYDEKGRLSCTMGENSMLRSSLLFQLFPFHVVFGPDMRIRNAGHGLQAVLSNIVGMGLNEVFELKRPFVRFSYDSIQTYENNVFELASRSFITRDVLNGCPLSSVSHNGTPNSPAAQFAHSTATPIVEEDAENGSDVDSHHSNQSNGKREDESSEDVPRVPKVIRLQYTRSELPQYFARGVPMLKTTEIIEEVFHPQQLRLKGQMLAVPEWKSYIFLGTPLLPNLEAMFNTGLYINDLSMHDSTRDLVLAGTQQSAELKLALDQEQQKSAQLEASMKKLDQEMKRTDSLLYQMIPRQVADKLRRGEPATSTCEIFREVSILFSDVVGFTTICSKINPMAVVSLLNAMYTKFDKLSEEYMVYKVETIGDAYMVVAGAPTATKYHAVLVAEMALAMLEAVHDLRVPSSKEFVRIRVGIHSGTVVAGVVGLKMPRYCLFGDAVNTASRMESNGEAMHVHLSDVTKQYLDEFGDTYQMVERGSVLIKGKGQMKTYWLKGKVLHDDQIDPCVAGKEDVIHNGGRSRASSLADSPILRSKFPLKKKVHSSDDITAGENTVSVTSVRMDTMAVQRPRSGSLFSSPIYTPVGFEDLDPDADGEPGLEAVDGAPSFTDNNGDAPLTNGGCICPMHGRLVPTAELIDASVQATEPYADGHRPPNVKQTSPVDPVEQQDSPGTVTHSLACTLV